ncbi:DUF1190 domain-containing protein [Vibrio crassostreae]|nr:conserved hypothetical protein [Vibrio chagasii]CAK2845972.1 DUF1190 domain-containing protein [Vibrio crassostreae]
MTDSKRRMRSSNFNVDGKRKAIKKFALTPVALATLAGCQPNTQLEINVFKDVSSCKGDADNQITAVCDTAYKKALREADRTSPKFSDKDRCELEFGSCAEMPGSLGYRPAMAAFMVAGLTPEHYDDYNISREYGDVFVQPLFTSTSSYVDRYGKLFFADGVTIGDYANLNELKYTMTDRYLHPLPSQFVEEVNFNTYGDSSSSAYASSDSYDSEHYKSGNSSNSAVDTLASAYIISELIDEMGDASERRHRERMYKERLKREEEQRRLYGTTGSTTSSSKNSNSANKVSNLNKSQKPSYKSKPAVKTKSKGGWGSTSSSKSSWGS